RLRAPAAHHPPEARLLTGPELAAPVLEPVQQHPAQHQLEAPLRDGWETEVLRDDFALLGDLDPAVYRARGQRGERARHGRAAAAAPRAAAPEDHRPRR